MVSDYLGEEIAFHKRAGYLGINGNLASCTALHGIVLILCAFGHARCSCIGDDGLLVLKWEGELEAGEIDQRYLTTVLAILNLIGVVSKEKSRTIPPSDNETSANNESWVYVKRPITLLNGELIEGPLFDFPSHALIHRYGSNCTTRTMHFDMVDGEVLPRVASQVFRLRTRIWEERLHLGPEEYDFLKKYFYRCYKQLRWNFRGHIGQWEKMKMDEDGDVFKSIPLYFYPAIPGSFEEWEMEPLALTVHRYLSQADCSKVITYPVATKVEIKRTFGSLTLGSSVVSTSYTINQLLFKYGYADKSIELREAKVIDAVEDLFYLLNGKVMPLYRYTLVHDVPVWFGDVVSCVQGAPYVADIDL
jgi:hypothetical protein